MMIVALEGPSFSGKTQLLSDLRSSFDGLDVLASACYVEEIAQASEIPPARTHSTEEQLGAFKLFMTIEARRVQQFAQHKADLVMLDRSVDTLLAHAYALDLLFGYKAYQPSLALLSQLPYLLPDLTFYLDASPESLQMRCRLGGQSFDPFLLDPGFISHFRSYFISSGLAVSKRIHIVNAEATKSRVAKDVSKVLSLSEESKQ